MAAREFESRVATGGAQDLVNVTDRLVRAVGESGIRTGIVLASVPHSTCALVLNEDEEGLRQDLLRLACEALGPLRRGGPFAHDRIDDNASAHLTSTLFQASLSLPVSAGRPALGTWQSLFLLELDGPRQRTLRITVLGE